MADIIIVLSLLLSQFLRSNRQRNICMGKALAVAADRVTVKESKRKTFRWSCDGNENNEDQRYDL